MTVSLHLPPIAVWLLSIPIGFILVGGCLKFMRWTAGIPRPTFKPVDFWVGTTERLVAMALLCHAPQYLAAFIGGWIALKFAANWKRLDNKTDPTVAQGSLLSFVGNVVSFSFAIVVGAYLCPDGLRSLTK